MHNFFGNLIKSVLWIAFFVVVIAFLYGWSKFDFNTTEYITFLDSIQLQNMFTSSGVVLPQDLSGVILEEDLSEDTSSLDVYDPKFEEDLINMSGATLSSGSTQEDFGFTDSYQSTGNQEVATGQKPLTGSDKKEIIDLLKREK